MTMTRQELEAHPKPYITPEIAARVIGGDAHAIRLQARRKPELLGFPVCVIGTRIKIPKQAFIAYWFGKDPNNK